MSEPRFDPGGFFEFNLAKGSVQTRTGARVLLLSDTVMAPLVSAAVDRGDLTPVRRLGREIGQHVVEALGGSPSRMAPETVLGHAAPTLALFGWGRIGWERWGDALVAVAEDLPALDEERLGVAALLGGFFSALVGRDVACVPADERRFVLVDPSIAEQVWIWTKDGDDLPTIVGRLESAKGAT